MTKPLNYVPMKIIKDVGESPISNTQKIRILQVEDSKSRPRVSLQKWWRPNTESEWRVGKGFMLTHEEAKTIGAALLQVDETVHN